MAKKKIKYVLDGALKKEIISKSEDNSMIAEDKEPERFYCNFKIHKPHEKILPPRLLISGCKRIRENIGRYVEYHIGKESTKHDTFLKDTPDFPRIIDRMNHGAELHPELLFSQWLPNPCTQI